MINKLKEVIAIKKLEKSGKKVVLMSPEQLSVFKRSHVDQTDIGHDIIVFTVEHNKPKLNSAEKIKLQSAEKQIFGKSYYWYDRIVEIDHQWELFKEFLIQEYKK